MSPRSVPLMWEYRPPYPLPPTGSLTEQHLADCEREDQIRRAAASLDVLDLAEECCEDELVALVKAGNPNAVGRWVLARCNARAERIADRVLGVA